MGWHFNPNLLWSHFVQHDSVSDTIGYQSRIQWEYRPGSRLFAVWNQNYLREFGSFSAQYTEVTLKIGMTLRF